MSADPKPVAMVCPACNSRYDEGGAFCSRDGTPLVKDPQSMQAPISSARCSPIAIASCGSSAKAAWGRSTRRSTSTSTSASRSSCCGPRSSRTPRRWRASVRRRGRRRRSATRTSSRSKISRRCRRAPSIWRWSILDGQSRSPSACARRPPLGFGEALDVILQVVGGPRRRARQGHRPPRHEAGEHLPGAEVRAPAREDPRLRHRQGVGRRRQPLADAHRGRSSERRTTCRRSRRSASRSIMRADIYSVGVIMYELFTGKVPFEAESFMGILTKHITTAPVPPRQVAPEREIPPAIEAVILRALAKEADERYQTMAELSARAGGDRERAGARGAAAAAGVAGAGAHLEAGCRRCCRRATSTPRPTPLPRPPSGAQRLSRRADGERPTPRGRRRRRSRRRRISRSPRCCVAAAAGAVVYVTRYAGADAAAAAAR